MRKAGWAQESTFIRHYLKDIAAQPQLIPPEVKKSVVLSVPGVSDTFHRKHARAVEAELQLARNMKKFSTMWNEDTQGNSLAKISKLVTEFKEADKKKTPPNVFALAHQSKVNLSEDDHDQSVEQLLPLTAQDVDEILPLTDHVDGLEVVPGPNEELEMMVEPPDSEQNVSDINTDLLSQGPPFPRVVTQISRKREYLTCHHVLNVQIVQCCQSLMV